MEMAITEPTAADRKVLCVQCSLTHLKGQPFHYVPEEMWKSHQERDRKMDRYQKFRQCIKTLRQEQAALGESYLRPTPKVFTGLRRFLWETRIAFLRLFHPSMRSKQAGTRFVTRVRRARLSIHRS